MKKITFTILLLIAGISVGSVKNEARETSPPSIERQTETGHPLGRHTDMTINGSGNHMVEIQCAFSNQKKSTETFNIFTSPDATQPYITITLKPGTRAAPYKQNTSIRLRLFKEWWCHIYTPNNPKTNTKTYDYCSFFSIADQNVKHYYPFALHQTATESKQVTFKCHIEKQDGSGYFFKNPTT